MWFVINTVLKMYLSIVAVILLSVKCYNNKWPYFVDLYRKIKTSIISLLG